MTQHANLYRAHWYLVNGLLDWINEACDGPGAQNVAGIIKHLLDRTSPNTIFIWSGKVILGLGFASPNITLPDQINMILVSVLSNKCIIFLGFLSTSQTNIPVSKRTPPPPPKKIESAIVVLTNLMYCKT